MPQNLETLTVEQLFQRADRPTLSNFPGIAKTSRPSRKRKTSDRTPSTSGRSSRSTGSTRSYKPQFSEMGTSDRKFNSRKDAIAWGRCGAAFGTGISNMADVIEKEFYGVAQAAYESRMTELYGAPF